MTFEDYYKSREFDLAFKSQSPAEQKRAYQKAILSGCMACRSKDTVRLKAINGKIFCPLCLEAGLHPGTKSNNELKGQTENSPKPKLNLLESAKVAKKSVSKFPLNEFLEIVDFLEGSNEVEHIVRLLNENIIEHYKKNVLLFYGEKNIEEESESLELDIKETMELGLRSIFKLDEIMKLMGKDKVKSRNISKSHSWKELKDEF